MIEVISGKDWSCINKDEKLSFDVSNNDVGVENESVDISLMIKEDSSIDEIKNLYPDTNLYLTNENKYLKISLEKEVDIITPGLNRVLSDPYVVKVERVIYND